MLRTELNRRNPRPCIGNFPINGEMVKHPEMYTCVDNDELTTDWLERFAKSWWQDHDFREGGILLFVDECQILWNSRNWAKDRDRMTWLSFTSQHRKLGYNVVFIAQSMMMIDNQMRMNIEYEVHHRKISNIGIVGFLVGLLFLGRLFVSVTSYVSMKEKIGTEYWILRGKDVRLYDSYRTFSRNG